MVWIWIALSVMIAATLIVNLGLGEAVAKVSGKILQCPLCLSFWGTMAALLYSGADIIVTVVLSILMAYLSNFFGIILMILNQWYDKLWQRNNRKK
jgi:hypothetical protein